jgi:predicted site-specific integrase-resolvase
VVKLSEWAARNGVHYQTAWTWAKEGRMPVPVVQTPSGTWLVTQPAPQAAGRIVAYCRVSSGEQETDLEEQVARTVQGATSQGLAVAGVVREVGFRQLREVQERQAQGPQDGHPPLQAETEGAPGLQVHHRHDPYRA